jgi:hypothetical protein
VDRTTGAACLLTGDPKCFGFVGPAEPPRVGAAAVLEREGTAPLVGRVAEVRRLAEGYYAVAVS